MRAVVIYESMYGNTHKVADAIGQGLGEAFDVSVVPVAQVGAAALHDVDLVIVGGPTHIHGMSRASSRRAAVAAAQNQASGLRVEDGALGPGLRDWFFSLGHYSAKAAAFDTRMRGPAAVTGAASRKVSRLLKSHGFELIAGPESFLVSKQDRLEPDEASRARDWGSRLAGVVAASGSRR